MIPIESKDSFRIRLFNINDAFPAGEVFQEPALGLGYLKSYFDKHSHIKDKVEINIFKNNIWNNIIRSEPDVIGISSVTQDYTNAIRYARKIKDAGSKALVIIGGIHISTLPESFNDAFDIGVVGEGEETFRVLVETIYESGFNKERLMGIKGLVYKDGAELINTGKRDLIEDLDLIPQPDRKYLKLSSLLHILTARGCPYRCAYCSSTAFWGYKIRFHSAQRVVDEMRDLINLYHLRHISINDDLFAINRPRLYEIFGLMKEEKKLFKRITFGITARPNVVDEELCLLLKEMNVTHVSLGIESGSERMLKLLNRRLTVEQNYKAIRILKGHGFLVSTNFIVGFPEETADDLEKTYRFVLQSGSDGGVIALAVPYPNTQIWDSPKERGLVSKDMDFSKLRIMTDPSRLKSTDDFILLTKNIDKETCIKTALKISSILAKNNVRSLFSRQSLNFRNLLIILNDPLTFLPFIFSPLKKLIRTALKND